MKKIFFLLPLLIFACGKNRDVTHRGSETGRLPYQVLQQTYGGDTLTTTIGDTIDYSTTAEFYNFDKPVLVNGDTVGGSGTLIVNTLHSDTINLNSANMLIAAPTLGTLKFQYGGTELQFIQTGGYSGIGSNNFGGLQFANYSSHVLAAFRNDTTANDADSAIAWSAKAIKDYVSVNGGGGTGIVDTTVHDTNYVALFTGKATIGGSEDFWYDPGVDAEMMIGNTGVNLDALTLGLYADRDVHIQGADSVTIEGALRIWDSTYFMGYEAVTRYGYMYFDSVNHVMKIDSSVLASKYGLHLNVDIHELLKDTVGGEIPWYLSKDNFTHNIDTLTPRQVIRVLRAAIEYNLVQTAELEDRVSILENQSVPNTEPKVYLGIIIFLALLLLVFVIRK